MTHSPIALAAYALIVSCLVGLAATIIEPLLEPATNARRRLWIAALGVSVGWSALPFLPWSIPGVTDTADPTLAVLVESPALARLATAFLVAWAAASVAMLASLAFHTWSLRRAVRRCSSGMVGRRPVLLSEALGPAAIGCLRPSIVVPRWILRLSAAEQAYIVEHEEEHIQARDVLFLAGALGMVCAMPWNAGLWFQYRRLRLAMETRCDARVVARLGGHRDYAELLLRLAAAPAGQWSPSAGLRGSLEARIVALAARAAHRPRKVSLRLVCATAIAWAAVEAPRPSAAFTRPVPAAPVPGTMEPAAIPADKAAFERELARRKPLAR